MIGISVPTRQFQKWSAFQFQPVSFRNDRHFSSNPSVSEIIGISVPTRQFQKWSAFHLDNQHNQIQLATYCLPYIRLPNTPNHHIFTLKMATLMFTVTLDNFQHSTRPIPKVEVVRWTPVAKTEGQEWFLVCPICALRTGRTASVSTQLWPLLSQNVISCASST
jgi:hypothetical protein